MSTIFPRGLRILEKNQHKQAVKKASWQTKWKKSEPGEIYYANNKQPRVQLTDFFIQWEKSFDFWRLENKRQKSISFLTHKKEHFLHLKNEKVGP